MSVQLRPGTEYSVTHGSEAKTIIGTDYDWSFLNAQISNMVLPSSPTPQANQPADTIVSECGGEGLNIGRLTDLKPPFNASMH